MVNLSRRAADVITEAQEDGRDVAEFLAHALCTVAANIGSGLLSLTHGAR
ncbi:hypothetical protein [Streptomyces flaveolus]